jgi:ribonuclease Y
VGLAGLLLGFILHLLWSKISEEAARNEASVIIEEARHSAERLVQEAEIKSQNESFQKKEAFEIEVADIRKELRSVEKRLIYREETLNEKAIFLDSRETDLTNQKESLQKEESLIKKKSQDLEKLITSEQNILHELSGLNKEQATDMLLAKLEEQLEKDVASLIEKYMLKYRAEASKKAKDILTIAVQRCAVEYTAENVVATIDIPSDEMKGRIIGREGRNIRAFEKATGIDVIVDDTPGVVVVSGFNAIRREIARRSMEKLILDGRIHPARIEEIVEQTKAELIDLIMETGKHTSYEVGIHNLSSLEIELLGKMKFYTVIGQNLLQHTIEVVHLTAMLAGELNLDVALAKRAALLHDIGRVADEGQEGNHAQVGADIAKRCKEPMEVINAIAAHHEEVPARSLYAILLQVAHSIAIERLGARKPSLDRHIKRLQRLEDIAIEFPGIESAFVIQSGREIRCIVNADTVNDQKALILCRQLAKKVEEEMTYPGEIKIAMVRETRIIEYAT